MRSGRKAEELQTPYTRNHEDCSNSSSSGGGSSRNGGARNGEELEIGALPHHRLLEVRLRHSREEALVLPKGIAVLSPASTFNYFVL